tara:strand:+ start:269 stop:451 length:183 start_codon:yes stop_codon:yes gene_type:complete
MGGDGVMTDRKINLNEFVRWRNCIEMMYDSKLPSWYYNDKECRAEYVRQLDNPIFDLTEE